MINVIVAMSADDRRVIGLDGDLPWKLSADLRRFKEITTGNTVVMGRKTWESIPPKFRPLPNRRNIVLSRQDGYVDRVPENVSVASSLEEVVSTYRALPESATDEEWGELFVIGGESVYAEALPETDRIYLTEVSYDGPGDTFFPADPWETFERDSEWQRVSADKRNSHVSAFCVLRRREDS